MKIITDKNKAGICWLQAENRDDENLLDDLTKSLSNYDIDLKMDEGMNILIIYRQK